MGHSKENTFTKYIFVVPVFLLIISIFLLNACTIKESTTHHSSANQNTHSQKQTPPTTLDKENWKLPIAVPKGELYKVCGWLSNDQVLFITNQEQTSNLYSYNLVSGKSKVLYNSQDPIGTVQISPTRKYILIQTSPSTYEGKITIMDTKGKVKYSQIIVSHELAFEWNPYNDHKILISKFNEDWSFQLSLLNFEDHKIADLSLPQPFVKWIDQNRIAYLNWDNNSPSIFAPLLIYSFSDTKEVLAFSKIFQYSAFKNVLMTITVTEKDQSKAKYSFFDQKMQPIFSFSVPQLTKYSDWLVPYYDYNEYNKLFITFRPMNSMAADTYTEGFQLVSYNLVNGEDSVILEGLNNEPLTCSPSGKSCLYGNRFEKIIDLSTKKVEKLVKE